MAASDSAPSVRGVNTSEPNTGDNGASPFSSQRSQSPGIATTVGGTAENLPTLSEKHVRWLEENRGLDSELAIKLGLFTVPRKFGGRDGLAIPMVRDGRIINCKYRGPGKVFAQTPGAPRSFFNEDVLRDPAYEELPLLITEGEFDCISAIQAGHPRTVSVIDGADSNLDFIADIWSLLNGVPRIILGGDGDEKGQKLNAELARRFGAARCARLEYPEGCKDLNEVLKGHGRVATLRLINAARPFPIDGIYRLSQFAETELKTLPTGWINLDRHLKLWVPELMVITGIPQHGKSKFALHLLAQQVEEHDARPAIASFEVPVKPYVRDELRKFYGGPTDNADQWIEDNFVFIAATSQARTTTSISIG